MQLFLTFLAGLCLMVNMATSDSMYNDRPLRLQKRAGSVMTERGYPCVFPFTYLGKEYNECIQGQNKKWCAIVDPNFDEAKQWSYCTAGSKSSATIMTDHGPCVFPFTYQGKQYNKCIQGQSRKWCAILDANFDVAKHWAYCIEPTEAKPTPKKDDGNTITGARRECVIHCFHTLSCTRFQYDSVKGCTCLECPTKGKESSYSACQKKCKAKYCRANWSRDSCDCVYCFKPLDDGVTEKQKKLFVDLHNKYRREVALGQAGQPPAADMTEVVWDSKLASIAQTWTERCKFNHSGNAYGENLAMVGTIESAMEMWYEEKNEYSYNDRSCNGTCGHYTQIAWANSKKIGCGIAACSKTFGTNAYIVCNYSPRGNYGGQYPYKLGQACSQCPSNTQCNNGLCASTK